jgi:hypothetical protein
VVQPVSPQVSHGVAECADSGQDQALRVADVGDPHYEGPAAHRFTAFSTLRSFIP